MTSREKIKNKNLYLRLALSAAVLGFAVSAAMLFGSGGSWSMICLIFATSAFAVLFFVADYLHTGVICLVGIAAAFISRDIISVVWASVYIPAGWIIYQGVAKKITRTQITVRTAVFSGIIYAALILSVLISGAESGTVKERADQVIGSFVDENQDILLSMYVPVAEAESEEEQARRLELLKQEYAMNLKMMIPMIFALYALAYAYFATSVFRIIYNIFIGSRAISYPLKRLEWRLKLSPVSAVIIILCAVLNLLLINFDNPLPRIVITNVQYMLAPGFCIMGIYFSYDKLYNLYNKNRDIRSGVAPAFILIALCAFIIIIMQQYAMLALAVLVVMGLYMALIGDIKNFYEKTKKAVFGDDDDDDYYDDDDDF